MTAKMKKIKFIFFFLCVFMVLFILIFVVELMYCKVCNVLKSHKPNGASYYQVSYLTSDKIFSYLENSAYR